MTDTSVMRHVHALLSAVLASALCMAICQVIGLASHPETMADNLLFGASISFITFGATYAGSFFVPLVRGNRHRDRAGATL